MAIPLAPTLDTHQKSPTRKPSLSVTAQAKRNTAHLIRWSRVYRGPEGDDPRSACVAGNGRLVTARNAAGTLYTSYPWALGSGINPMTWASIQAGLVAGSGIGLIARTGEVLLAYTRGTTIYYRTSADNGINWSAEATIVAEGATVGDIALSYSAAGPDCCLFYTLPGTPTALKRLRRTAGAWAAAGTNWSKAASVASVTGISATHDGADFALLVAGTEATTTHRRIWAVQMGDLSLPANAWSGFSNVAEADAASTTTLSGPSIAAIAPGVYGAFARGETGPVAATVAHESHPYPAFGPTSTWSEPAPMAEITSTYGYELAYGSAAPNTVYAVTPSGIWQATINGNDDHSARVLSCKTRFGPTSAQCTVVLDNADAALGAMPSAAMPGTMTGGQLTIAPGYASGAAGAAEYGQTWRLTIDAIRYSLRAGARTVTIEASGPWEQLRRWRAPQAWSTPAGALTRFAVANRITGRASGIGIAAASLPYGPSAAFGAYSPSFTIPQGEDAATALQRLLRPLNDGARGETGILTIRNIESPWFADALTALAPEAWWRFTEPTATLVQDHAPARLHAGGSGGNLYTTTALTPGGLQGGQPTYYAHFDGIDDYINVPSAASLDMPANASFVALWRGTAAAPETGHIISRKAGATYFAFGVANAQLSFGSSAEGWSDVRGPSLQNDAWHLLAVTRQGGSTVTFYVDGTAVGSRASASAAAVAPAAAMFIGAEDAIGTNSLGGDLSELAYLPGTILTPAQVAALWLAISPAVSSFGANGGHQLTELAVIDQPPPANWIRIQGNARYSERSTAASVAQHGPRLTVERNLDADTNTKSDTYTTNALRRSTWNDPIGALTAPHHAGLELFDLIAVTDPTLGQSAQVYRILGLGLDFERGRAGSTYNSVLTLGTP